MTYILTWRTRQSNCNKKFRNPLLPRAVTFPERWSGRTQTLGTRSTLVLIMTKEKATLATRLKSNTHMLKIMQASAPPHLKLIYHSHDFSRIAFTTTIPVIELFVYLFPFSIH